MFVCSYIKQSKHTHTFHNIHHTKILISDQQFSKTAEVKHNIRSGTAQPALRSTAPRYEIIKNLVKLSLQH